MSLKLLDKSTESVYIGFSEILTKDLKTAAEFIENVEKGYQDYKFSIWVQKGDKAVIIKITRDDI